MVRNDSALVSDAESHPPVSAAAGRAALCAVFLLLVPGPGRGQEEAEEPERVGLGPSRILFEQPFVGRFDEVPYTNYGFENYSRRPELSSNLRYHYNSMGDPLIYGTQAVTWVERRGLGVQRGYSAIGESGGHGQTGNAFERLFGHVIVGTDGTDAWQAKFIYGDEIRTSLTPLTMKLSNLNGLRVDAGTGKDSFSALFSTLPFSRNSGQGPSTAGDVSARVPTMMLGAHYERKVGFLNFGGTFLNVHQYEPLMASKFESLQGRPGAVQTAPALIAIRILDDSPLDGRGGPVLHDVNVYVDGVLRPELEPFVVHLHKRGDDRQIYVQELLSNGNRKGLPPRPASNDYQTVNRGGAFSTYESYINYLATDVDVFYRGYEFPFFIDHLYYRDFKLHGQDHVVDEESGKTVHSEFAHELAEPSGDFLGMYTKGDLPQAFDGETYGILYIDLESVQQYITSVEVELTLANDYRLEVSEIPIARSTEFLPPDTHQDRYRYAPFFRTVARAGGNPQNGVPKRVRVKVGVPTGLRLASANVYGVLKGFELNAEFARGSQFAMYPSGLPGPRVPQDAVAINALEREKTPGVRNTISDNAWFVTLHRSFRRWDLGGELFSMGPLFTTEFRSFIAADEFNLSGTPIAYNNTILHRLVEDNDDNDRYPDSWYVNYFDKKQGQHDIDGVFPGLDADSDGIPDTNRNLNQQPDDLEPFLMYDADPQIFDYGVDLNHNDFIDSRENDWEADLPYDPDLGGVHLYGRYKPSPGLSLALGLLDAEQIAGGVPSDVLYTRLGYNRKVPAIGKFFTELSLERIRDGVEDPLSVYSDRVLTQADIQATNFPGLARNITIVPFQEEPLEDPLNYKNSSFVRLFTEARWRTVPNLTMHNKVKVEVNHQHAGELWDKTEQEGDRLSRWTMAHKIDYNWKIRERLSLFSGFKIRYRKEWRRSLALPVAHQRHLIPLMKLEYRLTARTRFQLGAQGITSKFPYSVTDFAEPEESFEQRDTVLMMTNLSRYFGYIISTNAGVRLRTKKFDDPAADEFRGERFTAAFINAILGFEDD